MSGKKSFSYLLLTLHFLTTTVSTNSSAVLYAIYPFIRVYKDGRVERLVGTEVVPASVDPTTGVRSKDVVITAPELHISARLYLPKTATSTHKLPLLVYFHGGAFFTESAFSPTYHNHLNSIVAEANVVAVSVNYRLAPEHPLPIGYQDSWHALKWVFSHSEGNGNETWLKNYADFMHVYLGGDSAGGNIAHNMAIRAGLDHEMDRAVIDGMFLNCPHFWGKTPIGNEASNPKEEARMESIWIHAYPNSTGFDDPLLNPAMDPNLWKLGCKRVLVYVAEKDILRDRDGIMRRH
ncbi:UNVERIFIED_CONTAM: 2-hydroxyisoflavanone dehydratase [Sesamum latifolium]|uniref:2-hydroxyisoflavanone dehydratase n=1 Tax=Sesamum latifolium TaxID=2727402 RepID=A0AAW2V002_9LAMI